MIEAILQRFGVVKNAERLKSELQRELDGQLKYGTIAIHAGLSASVLYAVAGLFGIITLVIVTLLFYTWLSIYLGNLGAMAVTASVFGLMTFIAILVGRNKMLRVPAYRPFIIPQFYKKVEHPLSEERPTKRPAEHSADSIHSSRQRETSLAAEDETRHWVLGLVKQGYAQHLSTGVPAVDSFLNNVRPDAELIAKEGLQNVEGHLRNGSRPTISAILLGGLIAGYVLSSRGGIKPR